MKNSIESRTPVINTFLSLLAFMWLFPFLFVVFNSLKSGQEYNLGNFWDLPTSFSISENYDYLASRIDLLSGFMNSLFYGLVAAFLAIVFSGLAAYAISALNIRGRLFWFLLIYCGTIFPFQMYLIPTFRFYSFTGIYDTKFGLIIFYIAICMPFCLFVLRNFFYTLPKELVEAAKMDGAKDLTILRKIYVPMAKAPIAALFLFQFTWVWNDLLFGMTLSKSAESRPIMASLSMLGGAGNNIPAVLLAAFIASIPTLLIFMVLSKSFEKGFIISTK